MSLYFPCVVLSFAESSSFLCVGLCIMFPVLFSSARDIFSPSTFLFVNKSCFLLSLHSGLVVALPFLTSGFNN